MGTSANDQRFAPAASVAPSGERLAPRTISGEPIQTSGGASIGVPGGCVTAHCSTSCHTLTLRLKPATGRPGRGAAIVSSAKYHNACGIAAQSRQRPLASRKVAPAKSPMRVSSGEAARCKEESGDSGMRIAMLGSAETRWNSAGPIFAARLTNHSVHCDSTGAHRKRVGLESPAL